MSTGPFTYALSAAAAFVIRSLYEHPERQTADEIVGQEHARDQVDFDGAQDGLRELERHGLAEGADGRWSLTDAGRAHQQAG